MQFVPFLILLVNFVIAEEEEVNDDSYSYHRFRGPVSGQIQQITVPGFYRNQQYSVDYVAKPDYLYTYAVEDPLSGISQNHKETRDGDAVLGEYTVLQPDGLMRIVRYIADGENGFKATVNYVKI